MNDKVDECELVEWQMDPVSDWDAAQTNQPLAQSTVLLLPITQGRAGSHCRPAKQSSLEGTHASCSSVLGTCQPHSCPFRGLGLGLDQQPSHWINTEFCSSASTMPAPVRIYQTAKA